MCLSIALFLAEAFATTILMIRVEGECSVALEHLNCSVPVQLSRA